jgi:thymidylate kinase
VEAVRVWKKSSSGRKFTVALVGGDGAGKSTIARHLEASFELPIKRMYMGISPISSDYALPITRLSKYLKLRSYRKVVAKSGFDTSQVVSTHNLPSRGVKRGPIWVTARTINRLIDTLYRQFVSFFYQMRGFVVVYDRHLLFETAPKVSTSKVKKRSWLTNFEFWLHSNLYPKPSLVLFLDASPEVLYARKGEATLEYLEKHRATILKQGEKMANFVTIDANQPFDEVFSDVTRRILEFYQSKNPKMRTRLQYYKQDHSL